MYDKKLNPDPITTRKGINFLSSLENTTMKKMFSTMVILAVMMLATLGHAASTYTPTWTPTATLTYTPSPTFTPTRTNTPVRGYGQTGRVIVQSQAFLQADAITVPGVSVLAGDTTVWKAKYLSNTVAVFSTGSASATFQLTVPADYMRNGSLWLYAVNTTVTNTVTVQADIARISMGNLTSTATVFVGPATNVQTQFIGRLYDSRWNRVWIPLSGTVGTSGVIKPGDTLNILLARTGASGNFNVATAEFEYDVNYPLRP